MKARHHATMMMAAPREKKPSGVIHHVVTGNGEREGSSGGGGNGPGGLPPDQTGPRIPIVTPLPVVFTLGTILKVLIPVIITLLGGFSAVIYFFHKTNIHMDDPTVHLTRGERGKLETKKEAKEARTELKDTITSQFKVETQGLKQELVKSQRDQIKVLGEELKTAQTAQSKRIMKQLRVNLRDIRRNR